MFATSLAFTATCSSEIAFSALLETLICGSGVGAACASGCGVRGMVVGGGGGALYYHICAAAGAAVRPATRTIALGPRNVMVRFACSVRRAGPEFNRRRLNPSGDK